MAKQRGCPSSGSSGTPNDSPWRDDKRKVKRAQRVRSEKKRRKQFNELIGQLSRLLPSGKRRTDKTSVLQQTINFLQHQKQKQQCQKQQQDLQIQRNEWKPSILTSKEFSLLMIEALDCFVLVVRMDGTISYVSDAVTSVLGHVPEDLLERNLQSFMPREDWNQIKEVLAPGTSSVDPLYELSVDLFCHFLCGGEVPPGTYEQVLLAGSVCCKQQGSTSAGLSWKQKAQPSEHDLSVCLITSVRPLIPRLIKEIAMLSVTGQKFTSRHSLDWKYLFLEQRAYDIIGYLPFEILGTSGYDYYHVDDLEKIAQCHESLRLYGKGTSCHYRFLTKGQQWLWLQTQHFISYHQWSSRPEFVVCTHTVVRYDEVLAQERIQNEECSKIISHHNTQTRHPELPEKSTMCDAPSVSGQVSISSESSQTESSQSWTFADLGDSEHIFPTSPQLPSSPCMSKPDSGCLVDTANQTNSFDSVSSFLDPLSRKKTVPGSPLDSTRCKEPGKQGRHGKETDESSIYWSPSESTVFAKRQTTSRESNNAIPSKPPAQLQLGVVQWLRSQLEQRTRSLQKDIQQQHNELQDIQHQIGQALHQRAQSHSSLQVFKVAAHPPIRTHDLLYPQMTLFPSTPFFQSPGLQSFHLQESGAMLQVPHHPTRQEQPVPVPSVAIQEPTHQLSNDQNCLKTQISTALNSLTPLQTMVTHGTQKLLNKCMQDGAFPLPLTPSYMTLPTSLPQRLPENPSSARLSTSTHPQPPPPPRMEATRHHNAILPARTPFVSRSRVLYPDTQSRRCPKSEPRLHCNVLQHSGSDSQVASTTPNIKYTRGSEQRAELLRQVGHVESNTSVDIGTSSQSSLRDRE
uniref:circadian locomoter output cycles protein kaput isoform X2 n=1 Tax=Myxine glutinosa TaxID=7769 RepID=UPI00358E4B7D